MAVLNERDNYAASGEKYHLGHAVLDVIGECRENLLNIGYVSSDLYPNKSDPNDEIQAYELRKKIAARTLQVLQDERYLSGPNLDLGIKQSFKLAKSFFTDQISEAQDLNAVVFYQEERATLYRILHSIRGLHTYREELRKVENYMRYGGQEPTMHPFYQNLLNKAKLELEKIHSGEEVQDSKRITLHTEKLRKELEQQFPEVISRWYKIKAVSSAFWNRRKRVFCGGLLVLSTALLVRNTAVKEVIKGVKERITDGISYGTATAEQVNEIAVTSQNPNIQNIFENYDSQSSPTPILSSTFPLPDRPFGNASIQNNEGIPPIETQVLQSENTMQNSYGNEDQLDRPQQDKNKYEATGQGRSEIESNEVSPKDKTSAEPIQPEESVEVKGRVKKLIEKIRENILYYNEGLNMPEELKGNTAIIYFAAGGSEGEFGNQKGEIYHTDANGAIGLRLLENKDGSYTLYVPIMTPITRDFLLPYRPYGHKCAKIKEIDYAWGQQGWEDVMEKHIFGLDGRSVSIGKESIANAINILFPEGITINSPVNFVAIDGTQFKEGKQRISGGEFLSYVADRKGLMGEVNYEGLQGDEARSAKGSAAISSIFQEFIRQPSAITRISEVYNLIRTQHPEVRELLNSITPEDLIAIVQGLATGQINLKIVTFGPKEFDTLSWQMFGHPLIAHYWDSTEYHTDESNIPPEANGMYGKEGALISGNERAYFENLRLIARAILLADMSNNS